MHKKSRFRVLLAFFSLILTLFLAEKLIDRFFPQKTYTRAYQGANDCFQRSNFTVFTLKPNCTMPFHDYDTGEKIETKINSLGYRGDDFEIAKKSGEKRILIEGDSFILGFGVKDDDVVTVRLEDRLKSPNTVGPLKNAKVINAGYAGGFGPDGYFLHLKNYGVKLAPDLVVFSVFVFNDFSDIADNEWYGVGKFGEPEKVVSKTTIVDDAGRLVPATIPFVYRLPVVRESNLAIIASEALDRLKNLIKHYSDRIKYKIVKPELPTGEAKDSSLPGEYVSRCLFGEICHRNTMHLFSDLISVIKASRNYNSHFVVLLIPTEFQIYPDILEKYKADSGIVEDLVLSVDPNPQRRIKQLLSKEDISFIDLLPVMRKSPERLYFKKDGHWNAVGHRLAAEEIYKWIMENYK